jgi:co-chaperonin GroES (HSP10)
MTWDVLRGRVVIREDLNADHRHVQHIIVPSASTRDNPNAVAEARTWHRGRVLALGPPMLTKRGAEVAYGFSVGDEVFFHFEHYERNATQRWEDGEMAVWVPQSCVDGVVES